MIHVIKFLLFGFVVLLLSGGAGCGKKSEPPKPGAAVIHPLIPGATPLPKFKHALPEGGAPELFGIAPDVALSAEEFLWRYSATLWGLTPGDELRRHRSVEKDGVLWTWFLQYHRGYQVFTEGEIILSTIGGRLDFGLVRLTGGLEVDLEVRIPEVTAKQLAMDQAASSLGVNKEAFAGAAGELVIEKHRRLAWRFLVLLEEPRIERWVDVDAGNGTILAEFELPSE